MGPTRTTLRGRSDPGFGAIGQVSAILARVGDLHYLRRTVAAVLVHIELDADGKVHRSSLLALTAGRQVASSWGATLYAALIVHDPNEVTAKKSREATQQQLSRVGADKVIIATTDTPVVPLWATIGNAWQGIIDHVRPRLVLFGADAPAAVELAPRTGSRIGARYLPRARSIGGDDIELRDRDGGYVRIGDSGAAVVLIGRTEKVPSAAVGSENDIDVIVLALPGGADARVEVAATSAAELAHTIGAIVVLGDDMATDKKVVTDAKKLAAQLGAPLVAGPAAAKAVGKGNVVERTTPLAPELCVAIGTTNLDLAGATSLVRVGGTQKTADGALPGLADIGVRELVKKLGSV